MILIVVSVAFGFLGIAIGALIGGDFCTVAFGIIGFFSPALYVLNRLYRGPKQKNDFNEDTKITLESLRNSGIITDEEFEKAIREFYEIKKVDDDKTRFDEGVHVLYKLWEKNIVADEEYKDRISLLKRLYNQK